MQPELATLAKNGEKPFFTIWTFFDCYVFILFALPMLIHYEDISYLKITRKVCNQEKSE
ncbi:hypothetical protein T4B_2216 [Trichinella pseudospiralis]|uniref:Uncharacterized protein n=1 Tax=Trichinella pseudospiralis TaxID=6337 RepID=A0A0V1GGU0_TRIPS|nr:hypothetical protein T4B_2216 [Trichinella pseudospiralis]